MAVTQANPKGPIIGTVISNPSVAQVADGWAMQVEVLLAASPPSPAPSSVAQHEIKLEVPWHHAYHFLDFDNGVDDGEDLEDRKRMQRAVPPARLYVTLEGVKVECKLVLRDEEEVYSGDLQSGFPDTKTILHAEFNIEGLDIPGSPIHFSVEMPNPEHKSKVMFIDEPSVHLTDGLTLKSEPMKSGPGGRAATSFVLAVVRVGLGPPPAPTIHL